MSIEHILVLPHLKIYNANAMSSPYTIGFPAMTAWLGAVHALERKVHSLNIPELSTVQFVGTAVSCHDLNLQTYRGRGDYVASIVGTANPLDKDGNRPAFVEEARCHLEVSLLIKVKGVDPSDHGLLSNEVEALCKTMKFASGDLMAMKPAEVFSFDKDDGSAYQKVVRHLMLGHVLVERRDLMVSEMQAGADALEAMLNHLKVMHRSAEDGDKIKWSASKKSKGWIVPMAVGFQGISPLGQAVNQRDADTPHRFAEAVLTLGEFVMAYKINGIDYFIEDIFWYHTFDADNDLYLCKTESLKHAVSL